MSFNGRLFGIYFFSNNTNKLRFLSVVLNWMWYVYQILRFKGDLFVSDHFLIMQYMDFMIMTVWSDNNELLWHIWIDILYYIYFIYLLYFDVVIYLHIALSPQFFFFKYFIFTVIGSSIYFIAFKCGWC